jgi:hypothetical protein
VILTSDPLTPAESEGEGVREEITSRKRRRKRRSFRLAGPAFWKRGAS